MVLPPFCFILLGGVGVILWGRYPRLGRALAGLSFALLWLVSTSAFNYPFLEMLQWDKPVDLRPGNGAQAIVVLGGGVARNSLEYGGVDTINSGTLDRVRYAAWLYRKTVLPILVSGGAPGPSTKAEADLMKNALE